MFHKEEILLRKQFHVACSIAFTLKSIFNYLVNVLMLFHVPLDDGSKTSTTTPAPATNVPTPTPPPTATATTSK